MPDRQCAKCGFMMTELDKICPRCKSAVNRPAAEAPRPVAVGRPAGPTRSAYDRRVVLVNRMRTAVTVIVVIAVAIGAKYAWDRYSYLRLTPAEVHRQIAQGDKSLVGKKMAWTGLVESTLTWHVNSAGETVFGTAAFDADARPHRTHIIKTNDGSFFAWDVDDKLSPAVEVTVIGNVKIPDDKTKAIIAGILASGYNVQIPDGPVLEKCIIKQ